MREGRDVTSEHPIPGFLDLQLARFFLLKTCFAFVAGMLILTKKKVEHTRTRSFVS